MKRHVTFAFLAATLFGSAAPAALAATDTECTAQFERADTNKDGMLKDDEATVYVGPIEAAGKPLITANTITRDEFVTYCRDGIIKVAGVAPSAPLPVPPAPADQRTVNAPMSPAAPVPPMANAPMRPGMPIPPAATPAPPDTSAIKTMAELSPGANSFTEGQAKSRFESYGFSDVSGLNKDNDGFWRGAAKKDGKTVNVVLDFKGNIAVN